MLFESLPNYPSNSSLTPYLRSIVTGDTMTLLLCAIKSQNQQNYTLCIHRTVSLAHHGIPRIWKQGTNNLYNHGVLRHIHPRKAHRLHCPGWKWKRYAHSGSPCHFRCNGLDRNRTLTNEWRVLGTVRSGNSKCWWSDGQRGARRMGETVPEWGRWIWGKFESRLESCVFVVFQPDRQIHA